MGHYFINDKNLNEEIKENKVVVNNIEFVFFTDNGVFNKKGLDYGTRLLLENFDFSSKQSFLDVGCGCGPIGIYIAKTSDNYTVDMIDVNERAIRLCEKSIKYNNLTNISVFKSNIYENINKKYDAILVNPPIHAGKKVVYEIIEQAKEHLNENGELWIVIRKDQGAKSMMKDMEELYSFYILDKSKGFMILKANVIDKK